MKAARMVGRTRVAGFKEALINPFDPAVCGVKLPEPFPVHTSTYKLTGAVQVSAGAGVLSGGIYLRPNAFYSMLNTSAFAAASSVLTIAGSMAPLAGTTSAYSATVPPTVMTSVRVVACGFKISVTQPFLQREGNMYVVPIPGSSDTPSYNTLNAISVLATSCPRLMTDDVTTAVLASPSILELPGAMRFSLSELGNSCVILADRPTSYAYADFMPCSEVNSLNATQSEYSTTAYTNATGVLISGTASTVSITKGSGHTCYAIYFDQLPNAAQNVVSIEYIYHCEGIPLVNLGTGFSTFVPSGVESSQTGTSWENVVSKVGRWGMYVADVATEYGPAIAKAYGGYTGANGVGALKMIGYGA